MSNHFKEQGGLRLFLFFILFLVMFKGLADAADLQAKVIHIADGDTITVLTDTKEQIKIRLNGIDCPERGQSFGRKATEFTKSLVAGQTVNINAFNLDRYGRTIADVILEDGRNLNQELVGEGWCWWYRKYAPGDTVLEQLETEAREAKKGLWKNSQPIPPWEFRHRGDRTTLDSEPTPSPSSTFEPSSKSFDSLPVVGNLRSGKYHRFDCPSFNAVAPPNRLIFPSVQAAEAAGFEVAGNCPH